MEIIKEGGIWEGVKVSVLSAFLCCQTEWLKPLPSPSALEMHAG